ncbi:MAG: hypothetical protein ACREAA_13770 [Candidatus Polarisedimenticolia bacterium]
MRFAALAVAITALAWVVAALAAPPAAPGVALGMGVAGLCAIGAVSLLSRLSRRAKEAGEGPAAQQAAQALLLGFAGLMLARMLGYLAFLGGVVVTRTFEPVSVCIGLVCGTLVFQVLEVAYIKRLT